MSNLSNGVGISISLPLTIVATKMSISSISKTMPIGDTSNNTTVKSMSNLSNGVGISISLPLTIVSTKMSISSISMTMSIGDTGDNTTVKTMSNLSNGVGIRISLPLAIVSTKMSISSISIMSVSNSSYNPNIVWVSSSECVVDRKSMSNLADGVGITVSFTLAIESSVANG